MSGIESQVFFCPGCYRWRPAAFGFRVEMIQYARQMRGPVPVSGWTPVTSPLILCGSCAPVPGVPLMEEVIQTE